MKPLKQVNYKLSFLKLTIITLFLIYSGMGFAQCEKEKRSLDQLQRRYNILFVNLEKQGKILEREAHKEEEKMSKGHHISFDVTMKQKKMSFDLVEVSMKNKSIKFDVPQVTMKNKSFNIPTVKTGWRVTNIGLGIKTKTLTVTTYNKKVIFKIPQFKMGTTEIVTKIPEFISKRQEIIMDIPQFVMKGPIPTREQKKKIEKKSIELSKKAEALDRSAISLLKRQNDEVSNSINGLFDCIETELKLQKIVAEKSFDKAITQLELGIKNVKGNKMNPENVISDDGTILNLILEKKKLQNSKKISLDNIDSAMHDLESQRLDSLTKLRNQILSSDDA